MQLICEGHHRISADEHVHLVMNKPVMDEEPVLVGSTPVDALGCSIYGTVLRDGGVYRMWYQAWADNWDGIDSTLVACVESDDGFTWRRPSYGLVEYAGSKANHLTDLPFHCPSVFIDPHADASARYRAVGFMRDPVHGYGYRMAYSADGLHWTVGPHKLFGYSGDVISSAWDSRHDCALIAMKNATRHGVLSRRTFYLSEWNQGGLTRPVLTWCADDYDDLQAHMRGFHSADYYGLGLMPTDTETAFGFLWNFRHLPPIHRWGDVGRVDLSLVYRTERWGRWQHVTGRPDWFSAAEAPVWARGALYTASTPIHVGEETRLYVTGAYDRHGEAGLQPINAVIDSLRGKGGFSKVGVLRWRRNRLLGYAAQYDGIVTLHSEPADGRAPILALNVDASQGDVRVRLLKRFNWEYIPIEEYGFEECEPITGDHQRVEVRWRGKNGLPAVPTTTPLVAEVKLTRATLWAFDFVS